MAERNNIRREFSYTRPILYNGESYPSADSLISDENGRKTKGTIFADANGQYFTLDRNRNAIPVMPVNELDEVTVPAPRGKNVLADAFGRYLTMGNDNTQVNNLPHRQYNSHLRENAERGAKEHALWDKEHPNLSAWRDAATAIPFGVAAIPLAGGTGSTLLGTTVGQAARNGLSTLMSNPIVEAANNAIGLGFAGKGAYDVSQGTFTPETAMDFLGLYPTGRYMTSLTKPRKVKDLNGTPNIFTVNSEDVDLGDLSLDISNSSKIGYPLRGEVDIPMNLKREAVAKYNSFINGEEYQNRLQRAGLEDHWDYMKDLTSRRINNNGYFPSKVQKVINNDSRIMGASSINPTSPNYGIILQENLPAEEVTPTLMHEISHWATGNAGTNNIVNGIQYPFRNDPNFEYIGDIMRYNEKTVPNISWDEILSKLPPETPIDKISEWEEDYRYLIRPTEKRARAMSLYQQAKDRGLSTDEFVDSYSGNGRLVPDAPGELKDMGKIFTLDNLKKYLRNFLSLSAPIGITTSINSNQYEQ